VVVRSLKPTKDLGLGKLLPYQQPNPILLKFKAKIFFLNKFLKIYIII